MKVRQAQIRCDRRKAFSNGLNKEDTGSFNEASGGEGGRYGRRLTSWSFSAVHLIGILACLRVMQGKAEKQMRSNGLLLEWKKRAPD